MNKRTHPPNGILPKSDFGIEILFGCPAWVRTRTKGIKNPCAAITPRDILKLGVDVGFAPTVSWGFGGIFNAHECKARAYS